MRERVLIRLAALATGSCLFPSTGGLSSDASAPDGSMAMDAPTTDGPAMDASVGDAPADVDAAAAPPAFVQVAARAFVDASTGTVFFNTPVHTGNTIVVGIDYYTVPGTLKLSDPKGNTYVQENALQSTMLFTAYDVIGGANSVTFSLAGGTSPEFEVYAHEYSGIKALDSTNVQTGTTTAMTSGPLTASQPNDLIFGYVVVNAGGGMAGTGFTQRSALDSNVTEDMLASMPGTVAATATKMNGTTWIMIGAAFKGF